jgi:hypothetical protein
MTIRGSRGTPVSKPPLSLFRSPLSLSLSSFSTRTHSLSQSLHALTLSHPLFTIALSHDQLDTKTLASRVRGA